RLFFDLVAARAGVVFQQLAFAFGELRRHHHVHGDELVAFRAAAHAGHPATAQAIVRAALRSWMERERDGTVERSYRDLAAERRLRERDADLEQHVQAVAPEHLVRRDA